jgi:predicted nucleotidyltransferase
MKTIDEIKMALISHKQELRDKYQISKIGVFGSVLRDEAGPSSDVDILVEFEQVPGLFRFLDVEEYLSALIGAKVDLVMKDALKPAIGRRILREVVYV